MDKLSPIRIPPIDTGVERLLTDADTKILELEGDALSGGGGSGGTGTVTSISAEQGIETESGSPITTTGTVRSSLKVNKQTGVTYAIVTGDRGSLITFSNGSAIAASIAAAGGTDFPNGWWCCIENRGAGTLTITPTTSTIDGASSLVIKQNQGILLFTDGVNYFTEKGIEKFQFPTSATDLDIVVFDGTTGDKIKDGNKKITDLALNKLSYIWQSENPAVTGTHARFYVDRAGSILEVRPNVVKGDGTVTMQLDVLKNGTTIYSSSTKPNVAAGGFTNGSFTPDTLTFSDGDYLQINIIASGNTTGPVRLVIKFKET
jgi:hypothetical protein